MKKGKYTEEQITELLKRMEAGQKARDLARELGVSEATLYIWKSKYGGLEVNEARRLRELERENGELKKLVADLSLDREALKAVIRKNVWSAARLQAESLSWVVWSAQMYPACLWRVCSPGHDEIRRVPVLRNPSAV